MVDTVLSRDKNWVRWKMENCQPFTRDRVPTKDFLEAKSGAQQLCKGKIIPKGMVMRSNLGFLASTQGEKGLERLKQADRYGSARPSNILFPCAHEMSDTRCQVW